MPNSGCPARVIAVESDREFGVSVLERLDALLRVAVNCLRPVQDSRISQCRPDAVMPRTLLLVDEFREFHPDDAISQKASLLDRFARPRPASTSARLKLAGRCAGAQYLGQVAVRALQCSKPTLI